MALPYSFGSATKPDALFFTQLQADLAAIATGQIPGTTTNDNAAAGNVGEYVESVVAIGSAVALTTSTAANITSISLTAGDWDVDALAYFVPNAATVNTTEACSIGTVSATLDGTAGRVQAVTIPTAGITGGSGHSCSIPPYRFSLSATTTIFLVAFAVFTTNTNAAFGRLAARRVR